MKLFSISGIIWEKLIGYFWDVWDVWLELMAKSKSVIYIL